MKMHIENIPPNPAPKPHLSLLEKDEEQEANRFPGHKVGVQSLKIPAELEMLKKFEYDAILTEARKTVLEEGLVAELALAISEKADSRFSVRGLADIENELVEACLDLTDIDIDRLIEQLNRKSLNYMLKNREILNFSRAAVDDCHLGRWNPTSTGVKSVIHFIRERWKFLASQPAQKVIMGFNGHLDVDVKADLIEAILAENGRDIDQLNLIQIKGSNPTREEILDIVEEHSNYINSEIISFQDIEELQLSGKEQAELFEQTISNQAAMFEKIFEICTDPVGVDRPRLMEIMGLNRLNPLQAAWILDNNLETINNCIEESRKEGYIGSEDKIRLIKELDDLKKALVRKSKFPTHLTHINSVNSLIGVGTSIVNQEEVYNAKGPKGSLAATIS